MKLKITSRYDNIAKKNKAALWVDDKNIWDIDHKHVTADVLAAIRNAYDIGRRHAISDMQAAISIPVEYLGFNAKWADERTVGKKGAK
jgi:hypothetical protein